MPTCSKQMQQPSCTTAACQRSHAAQLYTAQAVITTCWHVLAVLSLASIQTQTGLLLVGHANAANSLPAKLQLTFENTCSCFTALQVIISHVCGRRPAPPLFAHRHAVILHYTDM